MKLFGIKFNVIQACKQILGRISLFVHYFLEYEENGDLECINIHAGIFLIQSLIL